MPISPDQFKSFNDLILYLNELEEKITALEQENLALRNAMDQVADKHRALAEFVRDNWPKTGIVSKNVLVRALSVYGHFFVVQVMVSVLLFMLYMLLRTPLLTMLRSSVLP